MGKRSKINQLTIEQLDEIISDVWCNKIVKDFKERKIIRYETTLVCCFYYHLRKQMQAFPQLRIIAEKKFIKNKFLDLAIIEYDSKEDILNQELHSLKLRGKILVAMEFKIVGKITNKERKRVKNDVRKLAEIAKEHPSLERCYMFYTGNEEVKSICEEVSKEERKQFSKKFKQGKGIFMNVNSIEEPIFTIE